MAIQLKKGERFNLSKEVPGLKKVVAGLGWSMNKTGQSYDIDASVFMLGNNGKIPDEKYFIFYNNRKSPDGALEHSGDNQTGKGDGDDEIILIDLTQVNPVIETIVFVVTIHEGEEKKQSFSQVQNSFIRLYNPETGIELARYPLNEAFSNETAVEFGRLYHKNQEWRFEAVGNGYQAGLQRFVDQYHGDSKPADIPPPIPMPPPLPAPKFDLEKKLQEKAPHLFDLTKKAEISLQKVNLADHQAKVALCLDVSDSMYLLYSSGKIQRFAEKILALGCQFDANASIDIFLFAGDAQNLGEMNLENFQNFVQSVQQQYQGAGGTKYSPVMQLILDFYFHGQKTVMSRLKQLGNPDSTANLPVYVMFVTDGDAFDKVEAEKVLKASSRQPIFWQFMAIGAGGFKFLERLDNIPDKYLDNADFFSVTDPESIPDQKLYDLLMTEYPNWVKAAKSKQVLS